MHKTSPQHLRTQNLLLISKLLDFRDNISPFTLVLDSLEQSAKSLVREIIRRSRNTKRSIIFLSFESISPPKGVSHFIKAYSLEPQAIQSEIRTITSASPTQKHLIIIDTLHPLVTTTPNPAAYLTSLLTPSSSSSPPPSLLAVYHTDIPVSPQTHHPYSPPPFKLLLYIATATLTLHAPHHILAQRAAAARSLAAPVFGLAEAGVKSEGGILQGLGANKPGAVVVEAELKRRSGREIGVWFVLDWRAADEAGARDRSVDAKAEVVLFNDHPLFSPADGADGQKGGEGESEMHVGDVSFDLGLTEKQRQDREGVVLPYFDAQREVGDAGLGGRILYDMGVEDDFDEEEDEI